TENNFNEAFKTNFSQRNTFSKTRCQDESPICIQRIIEDKDYYLRASEFSKKIFHEHFNLDKVIEEYPKAYENGILGNRRMFSDALLILRSLMFFFNRHY